MATLTKPLVSAAALASAAAVVFASPVIAPAATAPTTSALSAAKVDLTSFATLLSLTPEDYSNAFFGGYGFILQPDQPESPDWAAQFLSPFTNCNLSCGVQGISGMAYMALDALTNGNTPFTPAADANVSALNYYFEGGLGPGNVYLLAQPFGNPASPLYDPAIASVIVLASQGLFALTTIYITALDAVSQLALLTVPQVGPYVYGAIQAYLGPNTSDEDFGDWGYFAGLSGLLRYVTDVILTGGNPFPPYPPPVTVPVTPPVIAPSAVLAAAAVSAPEAALAGESTPADESAAPESQATEDTSSIEAPVAAVDAPAEAEAADSPATPTEPAVVEVSTAADDVTTSIPAVDVAESAPAEAAATTPRPVRGAVKRAATSIAAAIGGSTAAKSGAAASDDQGADAPGSDAPGSDDKGSDDKGSDDKGSNDKDSDDSAG